MTLAATSLTYQFLNATAVGVGILLLVAALAATPTLAVNLVRNLRVHKNNQGLTPRAILRALTDTFIKPLFTLHRNRMAAVRRYEAHQHQARLNSMAAHPTATHARQAAMAAHPTARPNLHLIKGGVA